MAVLSCVTGLCYRFIMICVNKKTITFMPLLNFTYKGKITDFKKSQKRQFSQLSDSHFVPFKWLIRPPMAEACVFSPLVVVLKSGVSVDTFAPL